jgi:hypothetical protein
VSDIQTAAPGHLISVTQVSPTAAHPPLHLRLTAPDEPGFRLEKVPVHSLKEVWGILEVSQSQRATDNIHIARCRLYENNVG